MNKCGSLYIRVVISTFSLSLEKVAKQLVSVRGKIPCTPMLFFTSFKITKRCYLFHDSRNMIDARVPIVQIQQLTLRERGRDQSTCRKGSRVTTEALIPPNKTPTWLYMEESLTGSIAFAIQAIPLLFAKAEKLMIQKIILAQILFLGSQLQD